MIAVYEVYVGTTLYLMIEVYEVHRQAYGMNFVVLR
jgi:hypothetical protein